MADDRTQKKLVQFLDRRAWQPVLRAKPEKYAEGDRKLLERLQKKTETQKQRYEGYTDAGELRQEFQDDLHSGAAKKTQSDLKRLKLPVQADIADEFFALSDRLGVTADKEHHGRSQHHSGTKHRSKSSGSSGTTRKKIAANKSSANKSSAKKSSAKKATGRKRAAKKSARAK